MLIEQERPLNPHILKIKNLPPLPQASVRILSAVNNPDISIEELVAAIATSPALVGRLIGLANSAYFGRTGQIDDLREAIIQVLGLNLVKSLALGLVLNTELDSSRCRHFNAEQFWTEALLTASLAQKICLRVDKDKYDPSMVYTAGLLLNIGLLAAVFLVPDALNAILIEVEEYDLALDVKMHEDLGMDQYHCGYLLLKHWHLPEGYQTILKEFGSVDYQGENAAIIRLLKICSSTATYLSVHKDADPSALGSEFTVYGIKQDLIYKIINGLLERLDEVSDLAVKMTGK